MKRALSFCFSVCIAVAFTAGCSESPGPKQSYEASSFSDAASGERPTFLDLDGGVELLERSVEPIGGKVVFKYREGVVFVLFDDAKIGDAEFAQIEGLEWITHLVVANARLTDASLARLVGAKRLTSIDIAGNPITDAGLEHLMKLTKLNYIVLENTQVTADGVAELQETLPEAAVASSRQAVKGQP